jgi:hypothetical protein
VEITSRVVSGLLVGGLVLGGGGAVLATAGGSSSRGSSGKQQYCDPGDRHGCDDNGNPNSGPKHSTKGRAARITVRKYPRRRCYRGPLTFRITVKNRHRGARTRVFLDGRWRASTKKGSLTLHNHVERLSLGWHRLTVRTRGRDGKLVTKTTRFRRC